MKREIDFIVGVDRTRIKLIVTPASDGRVMVTVVIGCVTSSVFLPGVDRTVSKTVFIGSVMIECASQSEADDIVAFLNRSEAEIRRYQRNQGAA